jgi:serine/threonine-protein kinase
MTPERWAEIQATFEAALDLTAAERASFLERRCGADADLRREVEALLRADASSGILDGTAAQALGVDAAPNQVGRTVGPYRLLRELGAGGFGQVFLAERIDGRFEQRVALKLLRAEVGSQALLKRFAAERRILARMSHQHIARLFDGGETDDGRPYFVMEYIDGTAIVEHCATTNRSLVERLRLFCDACSAVQYAHGHLVIHRDLKPDNILVTADGTVKLLDFGIAKVVYPDESSPVTDPRMMMMTPQYAAPEQLYGEPVTVATDVYALGVVLYELATSKPPYDLAGVPRTQVAAVVEKADPPPSSRVAGVDRRLDAVCRRAMARRPEDRYPSVDRLREAVASLAGEGPAAGRRRRLLLACAASFVLGGGVALLLSRWLW